MALSQADIIRLVRLARFEASPEEIERFRVQINSVLERMNVLEEVDLSAVGELPAHGVRLRNDEIAPDKLQLPLAQLIELTAGFFTVPRMMADEKPQK